MRIWNELYQLYIELLKEVENNMYKNFLKRGLDLLFSIVFLMLFWPLFILISIIIRLDSKGSAIFKQERLGKNGKVFEIIKFRTMIDNAENIGTGLSTYEWDPRVTKVGKVLRKTSLDELPQIINVLKGDMSIIGPRPPVPYHPRKYTEYSPSQKRRFTIRPGITGYAQVKGRNSLKWDERIEYDVEYVEKLSFFLDMKILILTVVNVFKSKDIHGPERRLK